MQREIVFTYIGGGTGVNRAQRTMPVNFRATSEEKKYLKGYLDSCVSASSGPLDLPKPVAKKPRASIRNRSVVVSSQVSFGLLVALAQLDPKSRRLSTVTKLSRK